MTSHKFRLSMLLLVILGLYGLSYIRENNIGELQFVVIPSVLSTIPIWFLALSLRLWREENYLD